MKKNIISIGRQFGSGGREIGKKLAEDLGIPFYDHELILMASKESGLRPELFEQADEKTSGSMLQALAMGFSLNGAIYQPNDYFTDATLFQLQTDVIRQVAAEGSCVIVGRCADYILKEEPGLTSVFIHAEEECRKKRIMKDNPMSEKEAADIIKKTDKRRANYYSYYTDKTWGVSSSYHLSISSSAAGIEGCVEIIKHFIHLHSK